MKKELKNKRIYIRLTNEEYTFINDYCAKRGKSIPKFFRDNVQGLIKKQVADKK